MKFSMDADPSSLQPGPFDSDFAAAAAVQAPDQGGGSGIFSQMHKAAAMAQAMQQMMKTGTAEHHYVAGSKERVDRLAFLTATIVDCAARTITTLDLRRKTYRVESMDSSSGSGSSGGGSGGSKFTDDGTRVAISVTNTALGAREVGGLATNGYRSDMVMTTTKPSGESQTTNGNLLAYYSNDASPAPSSCASGRDAGPSGGAQGMAMMGQYALAMRALATRGISSRFSLKQSGPPLPLGKLAMYDAMSFSQSGHAVTISTERGNVRSIGADDPAFSIPSGFTQQQ